MLRTFRAKFLKWGQYEEIAEKLFEKNTKLDPLSLRFSQLQKMVVDLPDFEEPAETSSESKLEEIQMAWLELYQDNRD